MKLSGISVPAFHHYFFKFSAYLRRARGVYYVFRYSLIKLMLALNFGAVYNIININEEGGFVRTKRILVAGLALATVMGTNAMIYSPTFALPGDEVTGSVISTSKNITYGGEDDFSFSLSIKNSKKEDINIIKCNSTNPVFEGELLKEKVAKDKTESAVCKFTFVAKEDGSHYNAGEYKSNFSVSYKKEDKKPEPKLAEKGPKPEEPKLEESKPAEASMEIVKKIVAVPREKMAQLVYNGEEQAILSSDDITSGVIKVKGSIAATNAGNYSYTLTLADTDNYGWENSRRVNRRGEVNGNWRINRAGLNLSLSMDDWTYGEETSTPVLTGNTGEGEVIYSYFEGFRRLAGVPTDAGEYAICAGVLRTTNYEGGLVCTDFAINKREVTVVIKGDTGIFTHDGLKKSVGGYTATEISDELYAKEGKYLGDEETFKPLSATEVGTYVDNVTADNFTNINDNFDVTFEVTPSVLIIKEPAVVTPTVEKTTSTPVANPETGVFTAANEIANSNDSSATVVMAVVATITACGIVVARRAKR